jgi:hypothetical protein
MEGWFNEQWIVKDVKGNGYGLISGTISALSWRDLGKP